MQFGKDRFKLVLMEKSLFDHGFRNQIFQCLGELFDVVTDSVFCNIVSLIMVNFQARVRSLLVSRQGFVLYVQIPE